MKEVVKGRASDTMDTLVQQTESPFTAEVLHFPLSAKFRMPHIETFDGVRDPVDHLNTYKNQMELHGYQDLVRCRAFATTLKGPALAWFNRIPPSSISSFRELSIAFVSHFIGARTYRKPSYHLLTVKQGSQESLKSYVQRFNAESLKIDIPDEKFAITAFIAGLGVQSKNLMFSISKNPKASMAEVLAKAEKYINGEEALISKKESSSTRKEKSATDKQRGRSPRRQSDQEKSPSKERERSPKRRGNLRDRLGPPQFERRRGNLRDRLGPPQSERRWRYSPQRFTPPDSLSVQGPAGSAQRAVPEMADSDEIRPHHKRQHQVLRVPGNQAQNQAQNQTQNQNQTPTQQPPPRQTTTQHQQPLGEIHVISRGFAGGGESSSARKAHLRNIRSPEMGEIQAVSKLPRLDNTITFSDSDLEGCQHPHDDPLVVRAIVANTTVHRVLIDNGSSADIIFA